MLRLNPKRMPPYFGTRIHKAEPDGQLNLLELDEEEAPDPDDFLSNEAYLKAWNHWIETHQIPPGFGA